MDIEVRTVSSAGGQGTTANRSGGGRGRTEDRQRRDAGVVGVLRGGLAACASVAVTVFQSVSGTHWVVSEPRHTPSTNR